MANEATTGQTSTVERLGRYEILGEIASGGMATVYLGRVTGAKGFQRLVAIKRLHPHLESEEEFVSMFLDEARLAAKIRHPNVVGTLDVEDDEHLYIVMEYVEGDRLLALLRHAAKSGEKIPPAVAVRIAMDTLAGLHAAHELTDDDGSPLGLVHRDVSPQNILISVDGSVKLVDFGIAKASARLSVTRDGQLKGKIAYMAPEQTKRSEIDRRVDVFAMGIITWEMLTAKKLFNGESDVEVLNQLLFEPIPRLREVAPTVPASLDSVVARALERDPAKRFATAAEFADALERASKIFGGPATTKAIAAHLQKVSGEKIAKDRARVLAGAPPVPTDGATPSGVKRRATGQFSVPTLTNPGAAIPPAPPPGAPPPPRKATMVGLGGHVPPPPPRPSAPTFDAGPSLLDDDEDVPTAAIVRADVSKSLAAAMSAPAKPMSAPTDLMDDGPTTFDPASHERTDTARDAIGGPLPMTPSASLLAPTAGPRSMTQQLPAAVAPPAPSMAPQAMAFDAPFDAPVARAEPTKSKAGMIAVIAVLLMLLGGGGAVAFVKFGRGAEAGSSATTQPVVRNVAQPSAQSASSATGATSPAPSVEPQPAQTTQQQNVGAVNAVGGATTATAPVNNNVAVANERVAGPSNGGSTGSTSAAGGTHTPVETNHTNTTAQGGSMPNAPADPSGPPSAGANAQANTQANRPSHGGRRPSGGGRRPGTNGRPGASSDGDLFSGTPY